MLWRVVDTLVGSAEAVVKGKKHIISELTYRAAAAVGQGMDMDLRSDMNVDKNELSPSF